MVFHIFGKSIRTNICNLVVLAHANWQDRGFNLACQSLSFNKVIIYYNSNDAELIYAYKNSLALGFPSLAEGFGLPVIESLSYDKITIVNNIEPMKSLSSSKNLRKLDNRAVTWAMEITRIIDIKNKPRKLESKEDTSSGSKNLLKLNQQRMIIISCNKKSFEKDMKILDQKYKIERQIDIKTNYIVTVYFIIKV